MLSLLADHPIVASVETDEPAEAESTSRTDGLCTVAFSTFAADSELRDLLRSLVEGGVGVVSFAPVSDNLEEIFMQLTSTEEEVMVQ